MSAALAITGHMGITCMDHNTGNACWRVSGYLWKLVTHCKASCCCIPWVEGLEVDWAATSSVCWRYTATLPACACRQNCFLTYAWPITSWCAAHLCSKRSLHDMQNVRHQLQSDAVSLLIQATTFRPYCTVHIGMLLAGGVPRSLQIHSLCVPLKRRRCHHIPLQCPAVPGRASRAC